MKSIAIVGAGFSGLTLAFELYRLGIPVRIYERQKRSGGLLGTRRHALGLVETAANAVLANHEIEELFDELKVPFAGQRPERKRRYIYWDRPRRWPLSIASTFRLIRCAGGIALGKTDHFPESGETVHDWSKRTLGHECEERLLQPALQGIFAGTTRHLSAPLTLAALFGGQTEKGQKRGSVAPQLGMEQLIQHLEQFLKQSSGVEFFHDFDFRMPEQMTEPVVVCTSAWGAAEVLRDSDPDLSAKLATCESLPLVTVTSFFEPHAADLRGFGCLFPPPQGFTASGVLFNSCIFEGRSKMRSETWILGGSLKPETVTWSDEQIVDALVKDRQRLTGRYELPRATEITRWPRAIPNYSIAWEKTLKSLKTKPPLFLHGNYLGAIGLAKIYSRSRELALKLKEIYG